MYCEIVGSRQLSLIRETSMLIYLLIPRDACLLALTSLGAPLAILRTGVLFVGEDVKKIDRIYHNHEYKAQRKKPCVSC